MKNEQMSDVSVTLNYDIKQLFITRGKALTVFFDDGDGMIQAELRMSSDGQSLILLHEENLHIAKPFSYVYGGEDQ